MKNFGSTRKGIATWGLMVVGPLVATSLGCGPEQSAEYLESTEFLTSSVATNVAPRLLDAGWYHACGLSPIGAAQCWGRDDFGQVSDASEATITEIGAGAYHSCGLTADKTVDCWGRNNFGQLDAPTTEFEQLAVGAYHNCGLTALGTIECWGWNSYQQSTPPSDAGYVQISAGRFNACALKADGLATCWGGNQYGQSAPPPIPFSHISLGMNYGCGVTGLGKVMCWGPDGSFQAPLPGFIYKNDAVEVRAGDYHMCARRTPKSWTSKNGIVECVGNNWHGQTDAPTNKAFLQIATGYTLSCGLEDDGNVECWGSDSHGQSTPPAGVEFATSVIEPNLERDALAALYNATNGPVWASGTAWVSGVEDPSSNHCTWPGIYCTNGKVQMVGLSGANLTGSIPAEIGNLTELEFLVLNHNQLSGSIPNEIQNLSNLKQLALGDNALSGNIPEGIQDLAKLETLILADNQLTGVIPESLGGFIANLPWFYLQGNQFSCPYPSALISHFASEGDVCP